MKTLSKTELVSLTSHIRQWFNHGFSLKQNEALTLLITAQGGSSISVKVEPSSVRTLDELLSRNVNTLPDLSMRASAALRNNEFKSLGHLTRVLQVNNHKMLSSRNCGPITVREILQKLKEAGVPLKGTLPPAGPLELQALKSYPMTILMWKAGVRNHTLRGLLGDEWETLGDFVGRDGLNHALRLSAKLGRSTEPDCTLQGIENAISEMNNVVRLITGS